MIILYPLLLRVDYYLLFNVCMQFNRKIFIGAKEHYFRCSKDEF